MTVGYFAPLPPARTGVAEYAAGLLAGLSRLGTVEVGQRRATVCLYQIGNNPLHAEMYAAAIERPGVVLLHDAVLQHFLLGQLTEEQYIDEFVYNYGEWTRSLAREMYAQRAHSGTNPRYFQYPLLRRLVERSRAIIVHNAAAAAMVRAHGAQAEVVVIPHYFTAPPTPWPDDVQQVRDSCGVPAGGALFGVFGHLRETKRLPVVLRAFERAYAVNPKLCLLITGEPASRDLRRLLEAAASLPGVVRRDYLPDDAFWSHAVAVDACINLRYPTAGETSGIGIRLMGIGRPVIFTEGAEIQEYPVSACLRVEAGKPEEEMLAAYLLWLAQYPADAAAIGRQAAGHVAQYHQLAAVCEQVWAVLRRFSG